MLDKPPYDGVTSFTHVFYIGSVPNVFVVHPSLPVKDMKELIAFIRAQKDAVNYGSGGIGSCVSGLAHRGQYGDGLLSAVSEWKNGSRWPNAWPASARTPATRSC